jgi:hypothetical protein
MTLSRIQYHSLITVLMSKFLRHSAWFYSFDCCWVEFHSGNCHSDECCYSERHSASDHSAACHFTECHSADYKSTSCHSAACHSAEHLSSESFKYLTDMFNSSKSCSAECHFSNCCYAKFCSTDCHLENFLRLFKNDILFTVSAKACAVFFKMMGEKGKERG